jgi:hypothetical protein
MGRLRLSGFYNEIEDIIQLVLIDPATLLATYYNLQRFRTVGFQPRVEVRWGNTQIMTGATFTEYRGERWGWEAVAQASHTWKQFSLNTFFKYQGQTPIFLAREDGGVEWGWIGGFPWLDVSVSSAFWRKRLFVTAGLRNALNVRSVQANLAGGVHTGGGANSPVGMGRYPFVRIEMHLQKGTL